MAAAPSEELEEDEEDEEKDEDELEEAEEEQGGAEVDGIVVGGTWGCSLANLASYFSFTVARRVA